MIDFAQVLADNPLLDVAARYIGDSLRKRGTEYVGRCPMHSDSTPSFTVFKGRDGKHRWRCFPCAMGGDAIDLVAAVESVDKAEAVRRLTGGQLPPVGTYRMPVADDDESDRWVPVLPASLDAPAYDPARTYNPKRGREVSYRPKRVDTYRDAGGNILCHVVRLEFDGTKICPTITWCDGPGGARWVAKRMPPPYPLFGLDELAARPKDPVLLVEGEKCVEAGRLLMPGYVCVSWLGGTEGAKYADIGPLIGRRICGLPDADDAGRRAMTEIFKRVMQLTPTACV